MVLIALFTLVMIVMLPKLMDQMDPEFKAELEAQQRKGGVNPAVNFDVASFLAGTSSPATGVAASGGKGKKN
jgi:hypothetical protein